MLTSNGLIPGALFPEIISWGHFEILKTKLASSSTFEDIDLEKYTTVNSLLWFFWNPVSVTKFPSRTICKWGVPDPVCTRSWQ